METAEAYGSDIEDGIISYVDPRKKPLMMLLKRRSYMLNWSVEEVAKNTRTSEDISFLHIISQGILLRLTIEKGTFSSTWTLLVTGDGASSYAFELGKFDWSVRRNESLDVSIFNTSRWNGVIENVLCGQMKGRLTVGKNKMIFDGHQTSTGENKMIPGSHETHSSRIEMHGCFTRHEVQDTFMYCFGYRTHLFQDKMRWLFNEFFAMILTEIACCRIKQAKKHTDESIRNCTSTSVGFHDENEIDRISNKYKHDYATYLEGLVEKTSAAFVETLARSRLVFTMFFRENKFETRADFCSVTEPYDATTVLCFCQLVYRPDHRQLFPRSQSVDASVLDRLYQLAKNNTSSVFCMCKHFSTNRKQCDDMGVIRE